LTKPLQLTTGEFDEGDPLWTRDGERIYFITQRIDEPYYELPTTDIYFVPSSGGQVEKLTTVPMDIGQVALSPDGRQMAFHGSVTHPVRSYSQPDLWVMDVASGASPRNLTANYDFDMGDSVFGDNAAPRGGNGRTLHWSADGKTLFDVVAKQGRTQLVKVDAQSGAVSEITRGDQAVLDFSVTPDAHAMVALVSTPTMIGDLFAVAPDGSQQRITDLNQKLWSQLNLTPPRNSPTRASMANAFRPGSRSRPASTLRGSTRWFSIFTAARTRLMAGYSNTSSSGWQHVVMWCCT